MKIKVTPLLIKLGITTLVLLGTAFVGNWFIQGVLIYKYVQWIVWGFIFAIATGVLGFALATMLYPGHLKGIQALLKGRKKQKV